MTVRNLEIFVAVCEERSMSNAARRLFISQSSVSQAIAELEKHYEIKLFERISRKLHLTSHGRACLFHANEVLNTWRLMHMSMKGEAEHELLRLGACTTVGHSFIHSLADAYRERYPKGRIHVEINNSTLLEQELLAARLDLAIIQGRAGTRDLIYTGFMEDEMVLICHPRHPRAGKNVALSDLAREPFIVRERGSGSRKLLDDAFGNVGVAPETPWVCSNYDAIVQAVKHGRGLALLSIHLIRQELLNNSVACIGLNDHHFGRKFHLCRHRDKTLTASMRYFTELCGRILTVNPR
jgi:DNA-binding transcriptional LysR family regulator